ncbi:MAG: alanine:cation symporter family protein [Chitinophagales bacterium]|nr:alanine:cation symporter family protein [Chitinophagales bacterium]
MSKKTTTLLFLFLPFFLYAKETAINQIDEIFRNYTDWFVKFIFYEIPLTPTFKAPWVVLILIGGAIFFTLYFKFINLTGFTTAIQVVRGKYQDVEEYGTAYLKNNDEVLNSAEKAEGEVSHFQALATALSATVGLGNIAGVGVAISIGGPGATFWMIIGGFLGMATKFAECTLGVKYRDIGEDGTVFGGPMYYLKKGLAEKGMKNFGKFLSFLFAILITGGAFGIGNMFQANQASAQIVALFKLGEHGGLWVGFFLAILVASVIIGGIKRIAKVTEKLVPFMAILYLVSGFVVIAVNYHHILDAFRLILNGAFTGAGISGGIVGVMIQGFRRSTFSNEAGIGSAPTAHAAVKTKYAASEGVVALLEPFIDTVVICTMTALIIIIANFDAHFMEYGQETTEGVRLTAMAFDSVIPNYSIVLTIVVVLFAVSTMISWSYYGMQGWAFLFGKSKKIMMVYNVIFCIFIWIGSGVSLGAVVDFSDAMNFAMAVPNIIGMVILINVVKKELKKYQDAIALKHRHSKNG